MAARRYGMSGLSGGSSHHAEEAQKHLDTIEETLEYKATSGLTVQDTFSLASALAKAAVHINETQDGARKRSLSKQFRQLKDFVQSVKKVVADDVRRCTRR